MAPAGEYSVTERATAFAPGRVNVIGEHTDYNDGLALPFAIADGVTVRATAKTDDDGHDEDEGRARIEALASDLDESDRFPVANPGPAEGWRAYLHGVVAELAERGERIPAARL